MRVVLGIDAAWTVAQPSGVALVEGSPGDWCLVATAPSYRDFVALDETAAASSMAAPATQPEPHSLLATAKNLCGRPVDLVTVDMPVSRCPITRRRESDRRITERYARYWCSTHSPNASRPGEVSEKLRDGLGREGYPLGTTELVIPGLIEVYPHPALVELFAAPCRLEYKLSRARRYWPALTPAERRARLAEQWGRIVARLDLEIRGVAEALAPATIELSGRGLKAREDQIDAVICAWVGICALEGRAESFGNHKSAIWVPCPMPTDPARLETP